MMEDGNAPLEGSIEDGVPSNDNDVVVKSILVTPLEDFQGSSSGSTELPCIAIANVAKKAAQGQEQVNISRDANASPLASDSTELPASISRHDSVSNEGFIDTNLIHQPDAPKASASLTVPSFSTISSDQPSADSHLSAETAADFRDSDSEVIAIGVNHSHARLVSSELEAWSLQAQTANGAESQQSIVSEPQSTPVTNSGQGLVATQIAPMIQPDLEITDEAYAESTSTSFVSSITSEISRGILENERLYPHYGQYNYGMPVDEEEMDRMDLQHRKYELVIGDKHFLAPIGPSPQRILDLCTGTGIWALDVADMYPSAQVIGVDIAPIQPKWVAPNCEFEIDDVEATWTFQKNAFDFVHLRDPLYVVRDWPKLMLQCYEHLKPGAWLEIACIYPVPQCDDGSMPPDSSFKVVCDKFIEASRLFGAPADSPLRFVQYLQGAGFIDIAEHIFKVPSSPWPKDHRLKKIGALEMANVVAGATAFGLRAFEQAFGWSKEQTELAMIGFRRDVRNRKYHQYCQYFVVYGRRPFNASDSEL